MGPGRRTGSCAGIRRARRRRAYQIDLAAAVVEQDFAPVGCQGAHDDPADSGLAATALADEAEALAAADREADVLGSHDLVVDPLADDASLANPEGLRQVADLEQRAVRCHVGGFFR